MRRVPLLAWIALGVVGAHLLVFWMLADKHYLPKVRYLPPEQPPTFELRRQAGLDARTGEPVNRSDFTVSTRLATPPPKRN